MGLSSSTSSSPSPQALKTEADTPRQYLNLEDQRRGALAKADDFWEQLVAAMDGAGRIHYLNKSDDVRRIDVLRVSRSKNKCSTSGGVRLKFCILDPGRNALFNGDMDEWTECVRLLHSRRLTPKAGFYKNIPLIAMRNQRCMALWLYLDIDFDQQ
jgi:hypothetical protein